MNLSRDYAILSDNLLKVLYSVCYDTIPKKHTLFSGMKKLP
jgi:hypothetical protein